mgnify:CR=1 FL=1
MKTHQKVSFHFILGDVKKEKFFEGWLQAILKICLNIKNRLQISIICDKIRYHFIQIIISLS